MKTITKYLLGFALTAAVLTVIFRYALSYGIEGESTPIVILSACIYGIAMFLAGWFFGKREGEHLPISDVGFRFHFTTYFIHIGISLLWLSLGFGSKYEQVSWTIMTAIYWGIFVLIHFIVYLWMRKSTINNLDKEDLFD